MTRATGNSKRARWMKILERIQSQPGANTKYNPGRNDPLRQILRKVLKAIGG